MTQACYFVAPSWFLTDDGHALTVRDVERGGELRLDQTLRRALLEGDGAAHPMLEALGQVEPLIGRFAEQWPRTPLRPLTRTEVLVGSGRGQLFVELTARCNERCRHCYADSSPEREDALTEAEVRAVLDDARTLGFWGVQLTGGDPLLSPHCATAVSHARALGLERLEIYTNGLALSDRLLNELAPSRPAFAFSFYSADPTIHDAITRTPGSQRRTLSAIRRVRARGLLARASVIVTSHNRGTIEQTVAVLQEAGLSDTQIALDVERQVGRGQHDPLYSLTRASSASSAHHRSQARGFTGKAAVCADGRVTPCIFSRALTLGSIRTARLREILERDAPLGSSFEEALRRSQGERGEMACWECRLRTALLATETTENRNHA